MDWFKRATQGLTPQKKKELPDLWIKCPACDEIIFKRELEKQHSVCSKCKHHFTIPAKGYIGMLADEDSFQEAFEELSPKDFLKFRAKKKYADQLKDATKKTGAKDAIIAGACTLNNRRVMLCVMDFSFIGGSMGSVVGEKIALAIDQAIAEKRALLIVSASGGARMMEGAISLMQMAKTSARLVRLDEAGLPFISILTNPTTGGVTASYAMLGDVNIAEPGALIGFAGPRVIKRTIGEELPEGFQTSEFLLEHGFIDAIVERAEMKETISHILDVFCDDDSFEEQLNGAIDAAKLAEISAAGNFEAPEPEESN